MKIHNWKIEEYGRIDERCEATRWEDRTVVYFEIRIRYLVDG